MRPQRSVPAAIKAFAVGLKYISTSSGALSLHFCLLEILYNLKFFIKRPWRLRSFLPLILELKTYIGGLESHRDLLF